MSLPHSYVEGLFLNVTVFGNGAFKEDIKVKWDNKDGAVMQHGCCPYQEREAPGKHAHTHRTATWGHGDKAAACKPRREFSPET